MENLTTHRLRRSDSLESLSAQYRVPVCMIVRANMLGDGRLFADCLEIKIPHRCHCNRCAEVEAESARYIVQPSDTLYGIARGVGLTMRILMKANGMEDPEDIKPGDALIIPRLTGEVTCVRDGESMDDIARHFCISTARLRQANYVSPREDINPGMLLLIPHL